MRSVWDSPPEKAFPDAGRGRPTRARLHVGAPASRAARWPRRPTPRSNVPYFALTEHLGAGQGDRPGPRRRHRLDVGAGVRRACRRSGSICAPGGAALSPRPFGPEVGLGRVSGDGAGPGGRHGDVRGRRRCRRRTHFVRSVTKDLGTGLHRAGQRGGSRVLEPAEAADLTWALSQNPYGRPGRRAAHGHAGRRRPAADERGRDRARLDRRVHRRPGDGGVDRQRGDRVSAARTRRAPG